METPGHLAPHWRDPKLDPAGRKWQSDMKDEAQKRTSTGRERTKSLFRLLLHLLSSKLYLWSWFHSELGLHQRCVDFLQSEYLWTLTNFIQRRQEQLRTTPGTYVTNCKKKHICVHLGTVQYWGILMLLLLLAAIRFCVHRASPLASSCFSAFLLFSSQFFFSLKEILVGRIELELE